MEAVLNMQVNIPSSDANFFKELVTKMGWGIETKETALRKYIAGRPKDVKLSDKDIMAEVRAVRYGK